MNSAGDQNPSLELLSLINQKATLDFDETAALQFCKHPPGLRCLDRVNANLLTLKPLLETFEPDVTQYADIQALFSLHNAIQAPDLIGRLTAQRAILRNPMHGYTQDHLPYCIAAADPGQRHREAFRRMQAWLFACARLTFRPDASPVPGAKKPDAYRWKAYDRLVKAEKLLRDTASAGEQQTILDHYAFSHQRLEDIYREARSLREADISAQLTNWAGVIENIANAGLGTKIVSRPLGSGANRKIQNRKAPSTTPKPTDDLNDRAPRTLHVHTSDLDEVQVVSFSSDGLDRQETDAGLAYGDGIERPKVMQTRQRIRVSKGDSPRLAALRDKAILKSVAAQNQALPYELSRLSLYDVRTLHRGLKLLVEGKSGFNRNAADPTEIGALLALSFWTGVSAEAVATTVLIEKAAEHRYRANEIPYFDLDHDAWCPPRFMLKQPAGAKPEWVGTLVEPVTPRFLIKLAAAPMTLIRPWLDKARGLPAKTIDNAQVRPLFQVPDGSASALLDEAVAFLNWVNRKSQQTRLTLQRVGIHTYLAITDQTTDFSDAALLTGRCSFGMEAALYYYAPRVSRLRAQYHHATERLAQDLVELSGQPFSHDQAPLPEDEDERTGSAICPRIEFLRSVVATLADRVEAKHQGLHQAPSLATWVDFHNAYVAYIVMFLGYCTGYRDVSHPFPTIDRFDEQSEFLVISDKDSHGAPQTRIVWLPPIFRKQLAEYFVHLQQLSETFVLLGIPFVTAMLAPSPGRSGRFLSGRVVPGAPKSTLAAKRSAPPLFFFIATDGESWEKINRTSLKEQLGDVYPIQINANRHFLRTRLREASVPGEIVDAFMGHAGIGQEPFGRFSSITPVELRDTLSHPLSDLLKQCGWRVIARRARPKKKS